MELKENKENKEYELNVVDRLADIATVNSSELPDVLVDGYKEELEKLHASILEHLASNVDFDNYSEDEKNKLYDYAFIILDTYKAKIKHGICKFPLSGLEANTINKLTHQKVQYNSLTLFFGIHLKKYFFNKLVSTNFKTDNTIVDVEITFSQAIALYEILSSIVVTGLNKENYALANILFNLAEISKVYEHYNNLSQSAFKQIMEWNLQLSNLDMNALKGEISEKTAEEIINENK